MAGKNTVEGFPPAPEIPVICLGEVEAVCGLTASGSKSTNRCVCGFVQIAGIWPFIVCISGTLSLVCAGRLEDGDDFDACIFR